MALHDVARDGAILAAAQDSRIAILCQPPGEKSEKDLSWFDTSFLRELSRDGRVLIFNEVAYGQEGNVAIYLRKTDGSPAVRLGEGARPTLSPDGKWVACIRNEGGRRELTLIPTGPGEGRKLTAAGFRYDSAEWFPDGRRLLVVGAADPQQPPRTYVQPLDGGAPMAVTTEGVRGHCVSPDGRVFLAVHQGRLMAFSLDPAANPPAPRVIGSAEPGNLALRWTPDGRAIFVQSIGLDQAVARIYRVDAASGRREVWKEIRPADPVGVTMGPAWVTPDGSAYAYTYYRDLASLFVIRGVGA
jgi:Tol biopolymer transport system component